MIRGVQQFSPGAEGKEKATDAFFDLSIWLVVLVPIVLAILIAALKKKQTPELPHVTDLTWQLDVVESVLPVVVHAYAAWSIGDRVIEKQAEKIAELHGDRFNVLWLDVEKNPGVVGRFPTLERRSIALFRNGELLWQGTGVHEHGDLVREMDEVLARAAAAE